MAGWAKLIPQVEKDAYLLPPQKYVLCGFLTFSIKADIYRGTTYYYTSTKVSHIGIQDKDITIKSTLLTQAGLYTVNQWMI